MRVECFIAIPQQHAVVVRGDLVDVADVFGDEHTLTVRPPPIGQHVQVCVGRRQEPLHLVVLTQIVGFGVEHLHHRQVVRVHRGPQRQVTSIRVGIDGDDSIGADRGEHLPQRRGHRGLPGPALESEDGDGVHRVLGCADALVDLSAAAFLLAGLELEPALVHRPAPTGVGHRRSVLVGGLDQVLADAGRGRLDRRAGPAVLICFDATSRRGLPIGHRLAHPVDVGGDGDLLGHVGPLILLGLRLRLRAPRGHLRARVLALRGRRGLPPGLSRGGAPLLAAVGETLIGLLR